jgi:ketosteroid isomerase-like protein
VRPLRVFATFAVFTAACNSVSNDTGNGAEIKRTTAAVNDSLPMADSAKALNDRIQEALQTTDSAAYMSQYGQDIVWLNDGTYNRGRDDMAKILGANLRAAKDVKISWRDQQIDQTGARTVAMSERFKMTMTVDGKPITREGVWSGVLGIRGGKTVVLQEHLSTGPEHR